MNYPRAAALLGLTFLSANTAMAVEDRVELETQFIKGNTEYPQVLYVVPWKNIEQQPTQEERIVLHSLFKDVFDPVAPEAFSANE